jgi:hypothetical protein
MREHGTVDSVRRTCSVLLAGVAALSVCGPVSADVITFTYDVLLEGQVDTGTVTATNVAPLFTATFTDVSPGVIDIEFHNSSSAAAGVNNVFLNLMDSIDPFTLGVAIFGGGAVVVRGTDASGPSDIGRFDFGVSALNFGSVLRVFGPAGFSSASFDAFSTPPEPGAAIYRGVAQIGGNWLADDGDDATPIPEPSTWVLLLAGLLVPVVVRTNGNRV